MMMNLILKAGSEQDLVAGLESIGLAKRDAEGNSFFVTKGFGHSFIFYGDGSQAALKWAGDLAPVISGIDVSEAVDDDPVIDADLPHLETAKRQAIKAVDQRHAEILRQLTGGASIEERDTWAPKSSAAVAVIAGDARPEQIAMLEAEASLTGQTVDELAASILQNATAFAQIAGLASGLRRKTNAAIAGVANATQIQPILDAAEESTKALISQVMLA